MWCFISEALKKQYLYVRKRSEAIAAPLSTEDMQIQSMPDASPIKWHLAHTSWAFETFILKNQIKNYQTFDQSFEYLFNSYYNAVGEQFPRADRGLLSRPNYKTIIEYRKHVDKLMCEFIENSEYSIAPKTIKLITLLINHEQQHQELMFTDLKHVLFQNPTFPAYEPDSRQSHRNQHIDQTLTWIDFAAGLYEIGHQDELFYFDNEGPQHKFYLESFKIASRLVSNGEYLSFIENGGYQNANYWLSEAWGLIKDKKTTAPLYWLKKDNKWFQYTLFGLQPLDLNQPVEHISYFEANAYASSLNKRLPTEQEWEVAARKVRAWKMQTQTDLKQMFNHLWQWTSSSYCAYPGFKVVDGAIGEYNGKFMVNQYVLRGGSKATPENHIRPSYRNFFYPNASWQYSGIRLAETL
ncbi:MAG: ergothioneine biosynthesis protein EgtB [Polaribacter sp.]|jgi:ergothioneine biosynthesis protein EgtB